MGIIMVYKPTYNWGSHPVEVDALNHLCIFAPPEPRMLIPPRKISRSCATSMLNKKDWRINFSIHYSNYCITLYPNSTKLSPEQKEVVLLNRSQYGR